MDKKTCCVCNKKSSQRCSRCHQASYCSKEHQRQDWTNHKPLCRLFKTSSNAEVGRHLVATRDIKAGEVVLREAPLVRGPKLYLTSPVCMGCLNAVTEASSKPCEKCGWPLCHKPQCRTSEEHTPECQWTVEKSRNPIPSQVGLLQYKIVMVLRMCYAKYHNPSLWSMLCKLQSEIMKEQENYECQENIKLIVETFHWFYKLEDISDEDIKQMWRIVLVNSFDVPSATFPYSAVYKTASILEHSCLGNCSRSFSSSGDIILRAVTDIPRGAHLSVNYVTGLYGTAERQKRLQLFTCKCARCVDPTELGSYFSAMICQLKKCRGPVLPQSLCSLTLTSPWTCEQCGQSRTNNVVQKLLLHADNELSMMGDLENSTECIRFLNKWDKILHSNHYFLMKVKLTLAQNIGQENGLTDITDELLDLKLSICQWFLDLQPTICSDGGSLVGFIYYSLYLSLLEIARRRISSPAKLILNLMEQKKCLEKTIFWLGQEPEGSDASYICNHANKELAKLVN